MIIAFLETPGGNHVNRAIEDALQLVLQVEQIKQRAVRRELDQEVDIAPSPSSPRAPDPKMATDVPRCRRTAAAIASRFSSTNLRLGPITSGYRGQAPWQLGFEEQHQPE